MSGLGVDRWIAITACVAGTERPAGRCGVLCEDKQPALGMDRHHSYRAEESLTMDITVW